MKINLKNAVDYFYPNPSYEQIYFEAIANAVDAGATNIDVKLDIGSFDNPKTLCIDISDNGSGFDDERFKKFSSLLEVDRADHKGLGRLVYLAYFEKVEVLSSYCGTKERSFIFSQSFNGTSNIKDVEKQASGSHLSFRTYTGSRIHSYDYLVPARIIESIKRHFFPLLFIKKSNDEKLMVRVSLNTDSPNKDYDFYSNTAEFTLDDIPELKQKVLQSNEIDFYQSIDIHYSIDRIKGQPTSIITDICIDGRTIDWSLIPPESLPSGTQAVFLFRSDYFVGKSDSSRQKIELPSRISESNLRSVLRDEIGKIINEAMPEIKTHNAEKLKSLEDHYPHLNGYFKTGAVGLIKDDEVLEDAQKKYFLAQKHILEGGQLDDSRFETALELSSRMLTEYILFRTLIIAKLKTMSPSNSEADIHNLIVPRYETFKKSSFIESVYRNNAWLLDDKYMSYNTILSEADMDKVISAITLDTDVAKDTGRPDITLIFSGDPATERVDVVVVELKKQTDDEKENMYAITQLMQRAEKLAQYKSNIQRIWYYAVIKISDSFATRLSQMKWSPLFSRGRVFYQEFSSKDIFGQEIPTPTYVLSYDALIDDAECRNATFLEILKQGIKNASNA